MGGSLRAGGSHVFVLGVVVGGVARWDPAQEGHPVDGGFKLTVDWVGGLEEGEEGRKQGCEVDGRSVRIGDSRASKAILLANILHLRPKVFVGVRVGDDEGDERGEASLEKNLGALHAFAEGLGAQMSQ